MKAVLAATARGVRKGAAKRPLVLSILAAGLFCIAATAAGEPVKPPPASNNAPAPTRSAATPSASPPLAPMQADGTQSVQKRALSPAPPPAPKPDQNRRADTSPPKTEPANHPPKASEGKR